MKKLLVFLALFCPVFAATASDISFTAANVTLTSGQASTFTAAEAITAGQCIYINTTSSTVYKAKANTSANAASIGIALNGAGAGQPVSVVRNGGTINFGSAALTVGQVYVVSAANFGGIAPYSDLASTNYVTILGVATTTSALPVRVNISGVAKP